jgi:hypothetical protein
MVLTLYLKRNTAVLLNLVERRHHLLHGYRFGDAGAVQRVDGGGERGAALPARAGRRDASAGS